MVDLSPASLTMTWKKGKKGKPTTQNSILGQEFDPGVYEFMAQDACHLHQGFRAKLKANEEYTFRLHPATRKSGIDIEAYDQESNAIAADVYLDDRYMGVTPLQQAINLCAKDGSFRRKIEVRYQGKTESKNITLEENSISAHQIRF